MEYFPYPILSFPLYEDTFSINNIKLIAPGRQFREYSEQLTIREGVNVEKMKYNVKNSSFAINSVFFTLYLKVWKFVFSFFCKD